MRSVFRLFLLLNWTTSKCCDTLIYNNLKYFWRESLPTSGVVAGWQAGLNQILALYHSFTAYWLGEGESPGLTKCNPSEAYKVSDMK